MLHAVTMSFGLLVLWMLASQQWTSPQAWLIAGSASAACAMVAMRFGGISAAFSLLPRNSALALARAASVAGGVVTTIRSALSADVGLNPALIRIRTRVVRERERAAFAAVITSTPGLVVVETDAEGFLVHVLDESTVDENDLGRLERGSSPGGAA